MIHCALIPKPMQQMRVEIATYVHAGLLHAATYMYTPLAKLLARQARLGTTQDGSRNQAENYSSISATN